MILKIPISKIDLKNSLNLKSGYIKLQEQLSLSIYTSI